MKITKDTIVADIMSRDIITANKRDTLVEIEEKFEKHRIHHLPVLEGEELVGMISQGDLLIMKDWGTKLGLKRSEVYNREVLRSHNAEDIMSKEVVGVKEQTTIEELVKLMKPNNYHAFPVTRLGKLVGIVSGYDIVQKAFAQN